MSKRPGGAGYGAECGMPGVRDGERAVSLIGRRVDGRVSLLLVLLVSSVVRPQPRRSVDDYIDLALRRNPRIEAAERTVAAAREKTRVAGVLPDPSISGGYFISEVETRVGPQRARLGLSQKVPWPGKLTGKRDVARRALDARREESRRIRSHVVAAVRRTYASLYAAGEAVRVSRESLNLLQQWESVLLTDYANARTTQASVLKLQVEMAILEDDIESHRARGRKLREEMASLVNLDPPFEIPWPDTLPHVPVPAVYLESVDTLLASNPGVRTEAHRVEQARAEEALARRSYAPDFMLMTGYIVTGESSSSMVSPEEDGKDPWIVEVSASLPVWFGANRGRVRKAGELRRARELMLESAGDEVRAAMTGAAEEYRDADRRITLLREVVIPKARQSLAVVQEAYMNNRAELLDLLDAQRMLLDLEKTLAEQEARREKKAAVIEMLLGRARTQEKEEGRSGQ